MLDAEGSPELTKNVVTAAGGRRLAHALAALDRFDQPDADQAVRIQYAREGA